MYTPNKIYLTIDDSTKLTINNNILSSGYVHNHMYNNNYLYKMKYIQCQMVTDKMDCNIVTDNYDLVFNDY